MTNRTSPEDPTRREPAALSLEEVRDRLAAAGGPEYWRSLEELAATEEFEELVQREFPRQAAEWPRGLDRRRFLQLSGASMALGGLAACTKQPLERIVPYVKAPEEIVPGRPLYFASATTLGGYADGVLVESHMGRPTKLEGNPEHPAGSGATDLFTQASVLDLYDPDRSQVVKHLGRIRTWAAFFEETRAGLRSLEALGGARMRILTGTVTSPSLAAMLRRVLAAYPKARWHQYEPVHRDAVRAGALAAFGRPLAVRYDLARAGTIVALDSDFLTAGPGRLAHARDFAERRRVRSGRLAMNRLYAAESAPTATGTMADHRLPVRAAEIGELARALAAALGIEGVAAPEGFASGPRAHWVAAAAHDLAASRGEGLVIAGDYAPAPVHVLAHAINAALGNLGSTAIATEPIEAEPVDQGASLAALVEDMTAGEVDVLWVLGGDPLYDAPADYDMHRALFQVGRRIHWGLHENETSDFCHWHLPAAHELESWGDARAHDGTVTLLQPTILPLYGGRTALEVLSGITAEGERPGYELVRDHWRERSGAADFERWWRRALHDGYLPGTAAPAVEAAPRDAAAAEAAAALAAEREAGEGGLELVFRPDPTIWDGRFANNAWLQECPKPLSKLTWDNAAMVGPALAGRLGLESGRVVEIACGGRTLSAPVWVLPGQPDGTVTLHLGYGRKKTGKVGAGAGFNAYALRAAASPWRASGAEIRPTGERHPLASTQVHSNIAEVAQVGREAAKRHLVRAGTLERFESDPEFARHMGHAPPPELTLYPPVEYDGYAWGLAVDLSACTGCNACVVACQSENNIPAVGKEQVLAGREMHWIRVDRYYQGELDDPLVHHQPVMCMHCENAPCEVVCPVAATVHSDEGLNEMVYNRCVGTRYCSNNCPYKVRRFNFLKYSDTETPILKMLRNPDVTVRARGVMEKCTYCVQRINHARIESKREERPIRDGEVVTACQQACPSGAIVFGDVNDPGSRVSGWKAEPLNYGILEELNTRPRTSYLAKLRNPSPALAGLRKPEEPHA